LLVSFVFNFSALFQTCAPVFVLRFFLNLSVAFHLGNATNSSQNVSDHEKLRTTTSCDCSVRQALGSAVVFHVFLEELQQFLVTEVAAATGSQQNHDIFKNSTTISNLFGS
jgi:hypothetical protein